MLAEHNVAGVTLLTECQHMIIKTIAGVCASGSTAANAWLTSYRICNRISFKIGQRISHRMGYRIGYRLAVIELIAEFVIELALE